MEMTKREFLEAVITIEDIDTEVKGFAEEVLKKMDEANEKRRARNSEKAESMRPLMNVFLGYLGDEPLTASDITAKMVADGIERPDEKEVNVQWVSSIGKKLVDAGEVEKVDVKVKGKGTQKGYIAI